MVQDWWIQRHLRTGYKFKFSDPTQDLLNQKLWEWDQQCISVHHKPSRRCCCVQYLEPLSEAFKPPFSVMTPPMSREIPARHLFLTFIREETLQWCFSNLHDDKSYGKTCLKCSFSALTPTLRITVTGGSSREATFSTRVAAESYQWNF